MENKLRKRLEILKARAKRLDGGSPEGAAPAAGVDHQHDVPGVSECDVLPSVPPRDLPPLSLEETAPGRVLENGAGSCYVVTARGMTVDGCGRGEAHRFTACKVDGPSLAQVFGRQMRGITRKIHAERILFYDIETAGLSPSTYLFLGGVLTVRDGEFHVEQVLARDYTEEEAMLRRLNDLFDAADAVVTFNGRSFDMPFTRTRMAVHRIAAVETCTVLDLLWPVRRAFSNILPNCRLGTVEYYLTGVERSGDVPGREIPRVYHDFVRTGDARIMAGVMYHNRMDILAMVIMLNHLLQASHS